MQLPRHNLRIPGPTPCPDEVLDVLSGPMINHRGPEFRDILVRVTGKLRQVFLTEEYPVILTASGTGALEAAIVNTLSPGDRVLAVSVGSFGDRFASIARSYGADTIKMDFEWGTAADPEEIRRALRDDPAIKAVLITHNETSTGVTNDLQAISEVVKGEFDKLLLVDAVSSLGCLPLPADAWRCDVVGTASQKGLMVPPGLSFITLSPEAWKAYAEAKMPRFYFDVGTAKRYYERGETPWTPAVSIVYGLDVALDMLLDEGLENVYQRHVHVGQMTRDAMKGLGLPLLADGPHASNTVTAVSIPDGVDGQKLLSHLRVNDNVVLAAGQGKLASKIFRIGHMGRVSQDDLNQVFTAIEKALPLAGFHPARKSGV